MSKDNSQNESLNDKITRLLNAQFIDSYSALSDLSRSKDGSGRDARLVEAELKTIIKNNKDKEQKVDIASKAIACGFLRNDSDLIEKLGFDNKALKAIKQNAKNFIIDGVSEVLTRQFEELKKTKKTVDLKTLKDLEKQITEQLSIYQDGSKEEIEFAARKLVSSALKASDIKLSVFAKVYKLDQKYKEQSFWSVFKEKVFGIKPLKIDEAKVKEWISPIRNKLEVNFKNTSLENPKLLAAIGSFKEQFSNSINAGQEFKDLISVDVKEITKEQLQGMQKKTNELISSIPNISDSEKKMIKKQANKLLLDVIKGKGKELNVEAKAVLRSREWVQFFIKKIMNNAIKAPYAIKNARKELTKEILGQKTR